MKKLMMTAAIVCAAAFAQAANFTWGNGSYSIDNWNGNQPENPDLSAPMYEGGTMFLYLGTIGYDAASGFTGLDSAKAVVSGGYNADEYQYGTAIYVQSDLIAAEGGQDYTLILVEGSKADLADIADGDHFVLRTGTSESLYDADLSVYTANLTDPNAIGAADWTTYSSVPEPTSGLLLLLGVAGLALKRRRA